MTKQFIECLDLELLRKNLQGGIPNEQFDIKDLNDWRFLHKHPTYAVKRWKNYEAFGQDTKNTDLRCRENNSLFAEGKNIENGVNLNPSISVGGGRSYDSEKLEECLNKNSHYFLYRVKQGSINDISITIEIFWVPINILREWYSKNGNGKGKISKFNLNRCLMQYEIVRNRETLY